MEIIKISKELIRPNSWNPNEMNEKQRQALRESLEEFGEILPIVVREVGGEYEIVDGQHRFEAAEGGDITCVVIDADDTSAMRLTQILNRTRGEDNPQKLADLLEELSSQMAVEDLIKGMAIDSEDEFNEMLASLKANLPTEEDDEDYGGGLTDDDDMPEEVETRVKRGDIWELGRHRIMCGDSTSSNDVALLMDEEKLNVLLTDPPYGIEKTGIANDKLEDLTAVYGAIKNMFSYGKDNSTCFVFGVYPNLHQCYEQLSSDYVFIQDLYWLKGTGRSVARKFHPITEMILFFAKTDNYKWKEHKKSWEDYKWLFSEMTIELYEEAQRDPQQYLKRFPSKDELNNEITGVVDIKNVLKHSQNKGFMQTSVGTTFDKGVNKVTHPTMKPLALLEDLINSVSDVKDLIVDCFLGSGSTLIACEKTDRICYGMEISEHYCDVIIKRWEDYTGDVAAKIN